MPEYSNKPTTNGEFTGEVFVHLPQVEHARCGGKTRFCGSLSPSADEAEQQAAYKALRYMESRLKLVIVDMNYLDRVEAACKHNTMLEFLCRARDLCHNMMTQWSNMCDSLGSCVDVSPGQCLVTEDSRSIGTDYAATKFCKDGMAKIIDECHRAYQHADAILKDVQTCYAASSEDYE
jgi:hypothetical protein